MRLAGWIVSLMVVGVGSLAQAAPLTIDLVFEPSLGGPTGPINTTVPAGIAVSGVLVVDDAAFAAATGPFVELTEVDPELISLTISGSGFAFAGAASDFTYVTTDFVEVDLSILAAIDLGENLVGQPTGISGPGGGPPSFAVRFATFDGLPLSPAEIANGVVVGTAPPFSFPPPFPFSGGPGLTPFFTPPEFDPSGGGFANVELIQFQLTGAFVKVPLPGAAPLCLTGLAGLAWMGWRRERA